MRKFIAGAKDNGIKLTPWFALIADDFLWKWWNNLDNLDAVADTATLHNMTNKK
jgi:isopentenyl-diphosphate delta-isomerase